MLTNVPFALMYLTSGESSHMLAMMLSTVVRVLLWVATSPDDSYRENGGHTLK